MGRFNAQAGTRRFTNIFFCIAVGLWLMASPYVLGYSDLRVALWNNVTVGLAIAVIIFVQAYVGPPRATAGRIRWLSYLFGFWLVFSPLFLGYYPAAVPLWNDVIVGLMLVAVGLGFPWFSRRQMY